MDQEQTDNCFVKIVGGIENVAIFVLGYSCILFRRNCKCNCPKQIMWLVWRLLVL